MIKTYGKVYIENNDEYDMVFTTNKLLEEVKKILELKFHNICVKKSSE